MTYRICILIGLPGSGKSYFAQKVKEESEYPVQIIDVDHMMEGIKYSNHDKIHFYAEIARRTYGYRNAIFDGLYLSQNSIIETLQAIREITKDTSVNYQIELHYWLPDRSACLHNDIGRREKSAKNTILYTEIEYPDIEYIKAQTGFQDISLVEHKVVLKPDWKVFAEENCLFSEKKYLYSDEWCLGGTCVNYMGDIGYVDAKKQPISFMELDEFLEFKYPNMSWLLYKKLYKECVDIKIKELDDYYGGTVRYAYYCCDLEKLYDFLKNIDQSITHH